VLQFPLHSGVRNWVRDLNRLYRATPALYEIDFANDGYQWIDANNGDMSVIVFLRKSRAGHFVLVACNFTQVPRDNYQIGVPRGGRWLERLNSDAPYYGGGGIGNFGGVEAAPLPSHGQYHSLHLRLPPLGIVILTPE
jgi:1,4-alpha-glucan branching enzyme